MNPFLAKQYTSSLLLEAQELINAVAGMRVLNPNWKWWPSWLDVYPNAQLLPKIKAPVLVIHVSLACYHKPNGCY